MKKTHLLVLIFIWTMSLGLISPIAQAREGCEKYSEGKEPSCEKKFFCKTDKILENKEELSLTDEQIKTIKDMRLSVKKEMIESKAKIDILAEEIQALLHETVIDEEKAFSLIDEKYEQKKNKTKLIIKSYIELKKLLNDEQMKKLKELYKQCKIAR
ncbi:secreted protein [Candidatus Omnitrophus magneticus]|uniref:Secreted protein n=1 Tax=Candidatus Omnitrophus magneticus TaxID=1609969 RepID=A0A0F0CPT3_9BACT|nr:secreted protein [Candidatus Omnitrophus magneticus]